MALFVLSSKDGWVNIMYTGLDAVGVDQQPVENYNEWRLLYFISFLLLGCILRAEHVCGSRRRELSPLPRGARKGRKSQESREESPKIGKETQKV